MNVVCPDCGFHAPLPAFMVDTDARRVAELAAQLPKELGKPVLAYISLFSPVQRKLTWPRARKLLEELAPDIERGSIERKGRHWIAPAAVWLRALEYMQENRSSLKLPLKSHGYLHEVLVGLVEQAESSQERATEDQRRHAQRAGSTSAPVRVGQLPQMDEDELRHKQARSLASALLGRIDEDRRRKLPVRDLEGYAKDYRDTFGDAVVDTAIREAQSRLSSRPEAA